MKIEDLYTSSKNEINEDWKKLALGAATAATLSLGALSDLNNQSKEPEQPTNVSQITKNPSSSETLLKHSTNELEQILIKTAVAAGIQRN